MFAKPFCAVFSLFFLLSRGVQDWNQECNTANVALVLINQIADILYVSN